MCRFYLGPCLSRAMVMLVMYLVNPCLLTWLSTLTSDLPHPYGLPGNQWTLADPGTITRPALLFCLRYTKGLLPVWVRTLLCQTCSHPWLPEPCDAAGPAAPWHDVQIVVDQRLQRFAPEMALFWRLKLSLFSKIIYVLLSHLAIKKYFFQGGERMGLVWVFFFWLVLHQCKIYRWPSNCRYA